MVKIRLLKDNDWIIVKPWLYELAKESFGKVIPSILEKKIQEDYQKEPEGFVVSEDDSSRKVNGLLWFSTFPEKKSAFIHAIYVDPLYRGKGVSDSLMDYLEKYCKKRNLENIELNVTVGLEYAIRFYQRRGFEIRRYFMSKRTE
jgi:ribosomal protein S18 acetylase RimI-like enzyme